MHHVVVRRPLLIAACTVGGFLLAAFAVWRVPFFNPVKVRIAGGVTVEQRLSQDGPRCLPLWQERCAAAGVAWPPQRVRLYACKQERTLHVYAMRNNAWCWLHAMPITAASGRTGPKLREGDNQVPEGLYPIASLNPNSAYHRALRVGYPSDEDRAIARSEGRDRLGGDIMIHGSAVSIGCVAVGDSASEELFFLAATVGVDAIDALIVPHDLRRLEPPAGELPWLIERYRSATTEAKLLPIPPIRR